MANTKKTQPKVGIVMGSDSDFPIMKKAADILEKFGIEYEMTVISANRMPDIFFEYATDEELNLQPGQSYFIVDSDDAQEEMNDRLIYELMPRNKEYLAEGYLLKARDSFSDLFLKETGKLLYE